MRQSFSWWSFAGKGTEDSDLLQGAKAIGYEGVELIGRALWDQAIDAGLSIAAIGGHGTIASGLNDPANHERIEAEITANLVLAQQYKIPNLLVFSGNRRPHLTDDEGLAHTVAGLRRVAPLAEQAGVTLVMELLNSKVNHAGYQFDHSEWGCRVVQEVGSPNVRVLYDIYHAQIMEGDLIRTIQTHGAACFGHYHTAGNPGRHDLDDEQEIYYPAVVRAIAETGYDGYIGHEFSPKDDPLAALEAAYELVEGSLL